MKRKGLGRGLDALMGDGGEGKAAGGGGEGLRYVPLAKLRPGRGQPRTRFDEGGLRALADSIRKHGFLQPIVARPLPEEGVWEIIAGERRWRAAKLAGKTSAPVVERESDAQTAATLALVENLQRADLNPMEQSRGLARLIADGNLTHAEAGAAVGMSRAAVSNLLRLSELSAAAAAFAEDGKLPMAHARALLSLPKGEQDRAAKVIVDGGMSARQAEEYVRKMHRNIGGDDGDGIGGKDGGGDGGKFGKGNESNKSSGGIGNNIGDDNNTGGGKGQSIGNSGKGQTIGGASADADTARLEKQLSESLSAQVRISHHPSGKGTLTIYYGSMTTLQSAITRLRKKPRQNPAPD